MSCRSWWPLFAALPLVACVAELPDDPAFIQKEWVKGIERLGQALTPVYPPQSDIQVGDVYAVNSTDPDCPKAAQVGPQEIHAVKLETANVAQRLRDSYGRRFRFPATVTGSDGKTPLENQTYENVAGIYSDPMTTQLPTVAFPQFTLAAGKLTQFSGAATLNPLAAFFAGASRSDIRLSVTIPSGETYGLPYYPAVDALTEYCSQFAARGGKCSVGQLSGAILDGLRMPPCRPFPAMVTRLYMTREIKFTYEFSEAAGFASTVAVLTKNSEEERAAMATLLDSTKVANQPAATVEGATPAADAGKAQTPDPLATRDAVLTGLLKVLNDQLEQLKSAQEVQGSFANASYGVNSISLSRIYPQPLAIGYQAITCLPTKSGPGVACGVGTTGVVGPLRQTKNPGVLNDITSQ